jgi:hypothetical protein
MFEVSWGAINAYLNRNPTEGERYGGEAAAGKGAGIAKFELP